MSPIFMDRHEVHGSSAEDVAAAHQQDLKVQSRFGCKAMTYWCDEERGSVFCLIEAPTADAVREMHRHAHGLLPNQIVEVNPATVEMFLGRIGDPAATAGPVREAAFRAILFTDIAGFTDLTNTLGDDAALAVVRRHDDLVRRALRAHAGREVDRAGDGFLTCFDAVSRAAACAITIQAELAGQAAANPGSALQVRIGIGAGEPVADGDALFGSTVNLTARICAHAGPGQILVAPVVRELCTGKAYAFSDRGMASLKGFPDPVRLYELRWQA